VRVGSSTPTQQRQRSRLRASLLDVEETDKDIESDDESIDEDYEELSVHIDEDPKECVCGERDCLRYMKRWMNLQDDLRCGFFVVPSNIKSDHGENDKRKQFNARIRDLVYHYLRSNQAACQSTVAPDVNQNNVIHKFVAYHHFHPSILYPGNRGPVMLLTSEVARELDLHDRRNYIFDGDYEGMYLCAPNYSWQKVFMDLESAETTRARASSTPTWHANGSITADDTSKKSKLHDCIMNKKWDEGNQLCKDYKFMAQRWLEHRSKRTGAVTYRKLPIHNACVLGAPKTLILNLINAYPEGLEEQDEGGKLPLHLILSHNVSLDIITRMLKVYPEAANVADGNGMLPIHRACAVGASDSVVNALFLAHPTGVLQKDKRGRRSNQFAVRNKGFIVKPKISAGIFNLEVPEQVEPDVVATVPSFVKSEDEGESQGADIMTSYSRDHIVGQENFMENRSKFSNPQKPELERVYDPSAVSRDRTKSIHRAEKEEYSYEVRWGGKSNVVDQYDDSLRRGLGPIDVDAYSPSELPSQPSDEDVWVVETKSGVHFIKKRHKSDQLPSTNSNDDEWEITEKNGVALLIHKSETILSGDNADEKTEEEKTAIQLYRNGEYEKAREFFQAAIEAEEKRAKQDRNNASKARLMNNVGNCLLKQNNLGAANKFFEKAMNESAQSSTGYNDAPKLLYNMGCLYLRQKDYKQALEAFEQARAIRQGNLSDGNIDENELAEIAAIYSLEGIIHLKQRNYENSIECNRNILTIKEEGASGDFQDIMANLSQIHFDMGYAYAKLGGVTKAMESFNLCLATCGDSRVLKAQAYQSLAKVNVKMGELEKAELNCREALNLERGLDGSESKVVARTLHNLGLICYRAAAYDRAETSLEKSLLMTMALVGEENTEVAKIMLDIGKNYFSLKQFDEATRYLIDAGRIVLRSPTPENAEIKVSVQKWLKKVVRGKVKIRRKQTID